MQTWAGTGPDSLDPSRGPVPGGGWFHGGIPQILDLDQRLQEDLTLSPGLLSLVAVLRRGTSESGPDCKAGPDPSDRPRRDASPGPEPGPADRSRFRPRPTVLR